MRAAAAAAATLATLLVAGCAAQTITVEPRWLSPAEPGGPPSHRFVVRGDGWRVTPWPARFPLNAEATPSLGAMTGAGTVRPISCGVDAKATSYFDNQPDGPLICAEGAPDGAIHVRAVGDVSYVEAFDALEHSNWRIVVARRAGSREAEALIEDAGGRRTVRLTGADLPKVAIALDQGRVAVLHEGADGACQWTVFAIDGTAASVARTSPGPACDSSTQMQLLRDQVDDRPYLLTWKALRDYRLYDLGDLVGAPGNRAPLAFSGPVEAPVIVDGVLYYSAALDAQRRELIDAWNLTTGEQRRYAFPGASTTTASTPRFFAFVVPQRPDEPLGVLISDERGVLQRRSLADASPVA